MYHPKTTLDLNISPFENRPLHRNSRENRMSREFGGYQFKIENPFRDPKEEKLVPSALLSQVQHMQYISSKSIKRIQLPECKRTSGFLKNLYMMQEIAKKQEQKYTCLLKDGSKPRNRRISKQPMINPINMNEDDDEISLQLNGFYDYRERIEDQMSLFDCKNENYMTAQQPMCFYSNQEIQYNLMDEEMNDYFG